MTPPLPASPGGDRHDWDSEVQLSSGNCADMHQHRNVNRAEPALCWDCTMEIVVRAETKGFNRGVVASAKIVEDTIPTGHRAWDFREMARAILSIIKEEV